METFRDPKNLIAFTLTAAVMFGGFSVIPYVSFRSYPMWACPRRNCGWCLSRAESSRCAVRLRSGLADRFGKLPVYRTVAVISACLVLTVTNLPPVRLALAIGVVGAFMLSNAGRMVAALAMITASVESRFRGGFMSANSAVQHMSAGLGAFLGGKIVQETADKHLLYFGRVGLMSVAATLLSLWLAGLIRRDLSTSLAKPASDPASDLADWP